MKQLGFALCLIAAGIFLACPAWAGASGMSQDRVFEDVDKNNDGQITRDEFFVYLVRTAFVLVDKNGNDQIEISEWLIFEKAPNAKAEFAGLDTNNDGVLVYGEIAAPPVKRQNIDNLHGTMDKNSDGVLDKTELKKK